MAAKQPPCVSSRLFLHNKKTSKEHGGIAQASDTANLIDDEEVIPEHGGIQLVVKILQQHGHNTVQHLQQQQGTKLSIDPERHCFHLCIVNLVIGTLYCAKGNFEFGISRIMKSLEPYQKKVGTARQRKKREEK